jgi:hypothetical protein
MAAETAKDLRTAAMKELFARVQEQQRRLHFTDAKLCEFATTTLTAADPYHRFKATSLEFIGRLKTGPLKKLLSALEKATA